MADNNNEKYNEAMEEFERMRLHGEYQRIRDDEEARRMRRRMYSRGGYHSRRSPEEEMDDLIDALPAALGILFGVAIAYMLKAHDVGVYIMLGSLGFYGGVFVKHNAFGSEDAVTAFRSTKPAFVIALLGVLAGFLSLFAGIF